MAGGHCLVLDLVPDQPDRAVVVARQGYEYQETKIEGGVDAKLLQENTTLQRAVENLELELDAQRRELDLNNRRQERKASIELMKTWTLLQGGISLGIYGFISSMIALDGGAFLWHPLLLTTVMVLNVAAILIVLAVRRLVD